MNEAETRAELIDPLLKHCGWGVIDESRVLKEYQITAGKIQSGGKIGKKTIADTYWYIKVLNWQLLKLKAMNYLLVRAWYKQKSMPRY